MPVVMVPAVYWEVALGDTVGVKHCRPAKGKHRDRPLLPLSYKIGLEQLQESQDPDSFMFSFSCGLFPGHGEYVMCVKMFIAYRFAYRFEMMNKQKRPATPTM